MKAAAVVTRYDGGELPVMLIETNTNSALEVVEKLKQAVANHAFEWWKYFSNKAEGLCSWRIRTVRGKFNYTILLYRTSIWNGFCERLYFPTDFSSSGSLSHIS